MANFRKKIFFSIFILLSSIVIFASFTYLMGKVLSKDISLEPISPKINPDFKNSNFSSRSGVYLISYANGPEVYYKNQNALAASTLNKGIDFILNYRRSLLDPLFVKQHASILNQKKGAGFWLWKPWIILKTLESIPENEILIYADTGLLFRNPINSLIDLTHQQDIILFEYDPEKYWGKPINVTKREVFKALDCDTEQCHQGKHVWAGFLILKNTPKSRDFIKRWLELCCNEKLLTDDLDPLVQQHSDFKKHYHDEAILNALYNKNPSETFLFQSKVLFDKYATWHHRHSKIEDNSLLIAHYYNSYSKVYSILNELINNDLILFCRQLFSKHNGSS